MAKTDTHTKKSVKNSQNGQKPANAKNASKSSRAKKGDTAAQSDENKQRKQQAKQEAKLMLRLEEVQRDVQKAEQKLAKAQKSHEDALSQQYELEERLKKLRSPESSNVSTPTDGNTATTSTSDQGTALTLETPFIVQGAATVDTSLSDTATSDTATTDSIPTDATTNTPVSSTELDQLPAEGRTDVPDEAQMQNTEAASNGQNAPVTEGMQIESDGVSMPILTNDESAWPPPLIREEVVEAAQEEAPSDISKNEDETTPEETPEKSTATHRRSRRTNSAS